MNELPFAVTLNPGSSLANHTGTWRDDRPAFVTRTPPCHLACPAGQSIRDWLYRAEEGDYRDAWSLLVEQNPFPAVLGRVCFRPCEAACNRAQLDEAVGINSVERFLGDEAIEHGWSLPEPGPSTGQRVLVVGAGPCGLTAAYHLRRLGHHVTVMDAGRRPGGMMEAGIPAYRLPRDVLEAEIERIVKLGVEMKMGTRVEDVELARRAGGFDAALIAVGAQMDRHIDIPAGDTGRVVEALHYLRSVSHGTPLRFGRRVAAYGGGDTALDVARTAKRLGATEAIVIYRRTRDQMPAHASELEDALGEGIKLRWLESVRLAEGGDLLLETMELDESGFPQPTGRYEHLPVDGLVLAVGEEADLSLVGALPDVDVSNGVLGVDLNLMTGHAGLFAGGDASPGERSVAKAVGQGALAARRIDLWLAGRPAPRTVPVTEAGFDALNTWYYSDAPRTVRPTLVAARRASTFDEVVAGLDRESALFEARRCMSCGSCLECDNCYASCPDNAVIKLGRGERYSINYDYCKGCGICVEECPCGAIEMVPEDS